MKLQSYQLRLLDEYAELSSRIRKLKAFLSDPWFARLRPASKKLLSRQLDVMLEYSGILADRLEIEARTSPQLKRLLGGLVKNAK